MKQITKNIPLGTRDLIFEEVDGIHRLQERLRKLYNALGYRPVETPGTEYYDVFDHDGRIIKQEEMFKLTGGDGRIVVLRADCTAPIARLVSSKLKNEKLPLKLSYFQKVYRAVKNSKSEMLQGGVEIIGGDETECDLCALFTALETLDKCGGEYKIEIGHSMFFDSLMENFKLEENQKKMIKKYVATHNSSGYPFFEDKKAIEVARRLIGLCGGAEVFESAYRLADGNAKATEITNKLKSAFEAFRSAGYGEHIMLDFGMVQQIDYYTGIVFKGYIGGAGSAVLSGGRYDDLYDSFGFPAHACGFAVNLSNVPVSYEKSNVPEIRFDAGTESIIRAKEAVKGI